MENWEKFAQYVSLFNWLSLLEMKNRSVAFDFKILHQMLWMKCQHYKNTSSSKASFLQPWPRQMPAQRSELVVQIPTEQKRANFMGFLLPWKLPLRWFKSQRYRRYLLVICDRQVSELRHHFSADINTDYGCRDAFQEDHRLVKRCPRSLWNGVDFL